MSFISILFKEQQDRINSANARFPSFFSDLNLDQIADAVTGRWNEYNLQPFFSCKLNDVDAVNYRHEVFRDLENEGLYESIKLFTADMRTVRNYLKSIEKFYYTRQKEIWFLYAVEAYCKAIKSLGINLSSMPLRSRGFLSFYKFIIEYSAGIPFTSMMEETVLIKTSLSGVKYRIIIRGNSFTVQNYEAGIDYSMEIEKTFAKFRQGNVKDYRTEFKSVPEEMNHIEAQILDFVAQLNPGLFSRLSAFYARYKNFIDETILSFDREVHFYIAWMEHIRKFKHSGLKFCYPQMVINSKEIYSREGFDMALAEKLINKNKSIVCNDFYLKGKERIIVVTGPNQGGKTTFARMFGQLHYLAGTGCPVPGSNAKLFLCDRIFTQFERAEKVENLRGKLEDDLARIHFMFEQATSESIIIMNEIFNSTTLQDTRLLSTKVMEKILKLDLLCVWVTFIDELASFCEHTVSMTSTVVPENPASRTFKIVRQPPDGLAYAIAIAEKYKVTYNHIRKRIKL
jgi:energy-coupling factor transporter ATP-binding protein EcfA2